VFSWSLQKNSLTAFIGSVSCGPPTLLAEKLLLGPELFAGVCQRMADGIRNENPDADEQRVQELLRARLDLLERLGLL
jgi:hypothetical protein